MSILTDCYNVLSTAATSGRAPAAVPAFMRQAHPTRQAHGGSSSNLGAAATATPAATTAVAPPSSDSGPTSSPGPGTSGEPPRRSTAESIAQSHQPSIPPGLPRQGSGSARHSRHASAESFFAADAPGPAAWPSSQPAPEQQLFPGQPGQQQGPPEPYLHPARSSSSEVPPLGPQGSSGGDHDHHHWNPHNRFSSDEADAIVNAAMAAAAAAGMTPQPSPVRSAGGSLAGGSSDAGGSPAPATAAEGVPMLRPGSAGSLGGTASRPPSPADAAASASDRGGTSMPGMAATAGVRGSPDAVKGTTSSPAARPGSAVGGQQPAPAGRGGLLAGPGKIRVTLKVRPKT